MEITVLCYAKCSTCQKAVNWLDNNDIVYSLRPIKEKNPSADELKKWINMSNLPVKRFFNTSGLLYKSMNLKEKLPLMTEAEQINLLATDGMLVKRPLIVTNSNVFPGFNETEWKKITDNSNK